MPRNFRRNRRPNFKFGRRPRPPALPWASGIFALESVSRSTTVTQFAMFEWADFQYGTTVVQNKSHQLHRLQCKGGLALSPNATAIETENCSLIWAVYQSDTEDTDIEHWGATGSIFSTKSLYKWGVKTWVNTEIEASNKVANVQTNIPINFDLKFRRPQRFLPDGQLILAFQWLEDVSATLASATFTAVVRAVVQPGGMGR